MVEFITGAAGSGKTTRLFGRIKEQADLGREQCVIVPEQFSYEFDKKLYFFLGAESFNRLTSLSFTGLARQLFQLYGDPDRKGEYADDMARMILIHQAVSAVRDRPEGLRYFRRQSSHSGFAEEMLKMISDMKRSGVTPEELSAKSVLLDKRLGDKASDAAEIYSEYCRLMEEYGFKDDLDNIREAARTANMNRYFEGKNVYIDEFESFTADQLEMLRVMISSAENVCIALRTDDVNAGEYTLFEIVNNTCRKVMDICRELHKETRFTECKGAYRFNSPDLAYLSTHVMRDYRYAPGVTPFAENISIFEARDMYGEAEYVCAAIKRLIASDSSLRYRDIAVISNNIAGYADVLKAAFRRFEIPFFISLEKPVTHTAVMVYFTSLLDLLGARRFRSELIFRLIKSGVPGISLTDSSLLENYCYKWGVDGELWTKPFEAPDDELEKLEKIRQFIITPAVKLKKKLAGRNSASEICRLLYGHLSGCNAEENISRMMTELIKENRDYEAAELKRLWGCMIDILDSINDTLGENETTFREISDIIKSMIGRINYSVPPQTLDAVTAASARTARLSAPKIVFAMGTTDGDFPNQINRHGLFSEADKQKLSKHGLEVSTPLSELIASERLVVYKAMSAASDKLIITYPLSDLSGQAKYPAQIVDGIIKMFGSKDIRTRSDALPPHYYAVTMHSAFYHYMQNISKSTPSVAAIKKLLFTDSTYKRRLSYVLTRSDRMQDYHVDTAVMQKLKNFDPLKLSSTSLEDYDLCHFKFFCDKLLKLQVCEKMGFDARVAGEMSHECFFGILSSRTKEEFIGMSYDELQREIDKRADAYRAEKLAGDYGKDAASVLIFNKLKERLSAVFMYTQQSLMASDFTPSGFELDLRDTHSVVLPYAGGKKLSFGGIVDRADICEIGGKRYLRIVDYKSSRKDITPETLAGGVNLQMLLYLFASTDKGGIYEGMEPAGVLYSPVRIGEVSLEDHKVDSVNSAAVTTSLKNSGLVLGDMDVLRAMEKGVNGRYIPVKLDKNGVPDKKSSCISADGMKRLREYTYGKLTDMAQSLLSGDVEALPLMSGKKLPCTFCDYINICDNSQMKRYREPDSEDLAKAEMILSCKTDDKEEK